jgi:hypothetical protein
MKPWIAASLLAVFGLMTDSSLRADLIGLSSSIPGTLYNVSPTTGAATPIVDLTGSTGTGFVGLASLNGVIYATDVFSGGEAHFGTIDPATGAFTAINNQGGSLNWHSLAANPSTQSLYTVDLTRFGDDWMLLTVTPAGTIAQVGPTGIDIRGLAFDPNHGVLYGVGFDHVTSLLNLYTVDTATGHASLIGSTGFFNIRPDLAFDPSANLLFMNLGEGGSEGNKLYTLDAATGAPSLVGPNGLTAGFGIDGLTFVTATVPEPFSLTLLGIGIAGVAGYGLSHRKALVDRRGKEGAKPSASTRTTGAAP